MRKCFKCCSEKEEVEFGKGCTYCKKCESLRWKERYKKRKEAYSERKKKKYKNDFGHPCKECGLIFVDHGDFCSIQCKLYNSIEKRNGCWIWKKDCYPNGYGYGCFNGKNEYAHRVSYQHFIGPIERGKYICHKCDIKNCINPDHLFLGTPKDNMQDAKSKGRLNNKRICDDEQIKMIKSLKRQGFKTESIAEQFKIDQTTICEIVYGKRARKIE